MVRKVLVVDDEPDMEVLIRQKFRKQISSGNFNFLFAQNGEQGLGILLKEPDMEMVMTDINMPVMNGLTFLEKIRDAKLPCKSIVISAYTDIENIRSAMNRGAFDFITKPIDFNDLETTMMKTLRAVDEYRMANQAISERDKAIIEKEQARASAQFKQQFLANMSHEIRTPMNSVIGLANLLLRSPLEGSQKKYVRMIQSASEQLMSIINDILDISKIEAGKMSLESVPFNLREVISNVNNILVMKAEEKGLKIRIEIEDSIPQYIKGDPSRLAQVLINLVGNSIKFTSQGYIAVKVSLKQRLENVDLILFEVTDTGIGISKEKAENIFESFTQADSDTSRKYGGTGLGLTISRQLVELQGGNIGLESEPGVGTRFYFEIPYLQTDNPADNSESDPEIFINDLEDLRILLAEDNEFNRIVAEDTIRDYLKNVKIDHCSNGREAVEAVEKNDYDVVLMDIQMPEMDGYEAMQKIRSLGNKGKVPVIAMTANATPEEITKCFESGANEYVSKPFLPGTFFKALKKVMVKK